MIIFLIGFMGSGKTTVGKKLASRLNYHFSDLDEIIENGEQKSITTIFTDSGETYFRKLEQQYLIKTANNAANTVIATGGGTPCFFDNMDYMNKTGITIYLKMDHKSLKNRLKKSSNRPLLNNDKDKTEYINELLKKREVFYSRSKITVNGLSVKIEELIQTINKNITQGNNLS